MIDKIFVVGGTFDENGGKPSGYVNKVFSDIPKGNLINGGNLADLEFCLRRAQLNYINVWMPNVSNDLEKKLKDIKARNPKSILVMSKRNLDRRYSELELIARALDAKANLLLEINREEDEFVNKFVTLIMDPLGNRFGQSSDPQLVFEMLYKRIVRLTQFTRVGSAPAHIFIPPPQINDEQKRFLEICAPIADKFHGLIHAVNQNRFVGNLSFRCERGFPSFRGDGGFWVSRRNVDKRHLTLEDMSFVVSDPNPHTSVSYFGPVPSVDAAIHRYLYNIFPNINYMLHGHVYLKGRDICTNEVIPCGSLEEAFEITELAGDGHWYREKLAINLFGHGFLVMGGTPECFENLEFTPRT